MAGSEGLKFLLNQKKQKPYSFEPRRCNARVQMSKSFLLLFFKKEVLAA
jgi:hypothetical protein